MNKDNPINYIKRGIISFGVYDTANDINGLEISRDKAIECIKQQIDWDKEGKKLFPLNDDCRNAWMLAPFLYP